MGKKKTHDEYVDEVAKINPDIEVVGKYINSSTEILHRCRIDGYMWMVRPNNILSGEGCPKCNSRKRSLELRKTHDKYVLSLLSINPNIEVIGQYIDAETEILHRCKIDGYEWFATPHYMLRGHSCPVCSGHKIGPEPEYKNSIWASKYREYFSLYMSDEQMKRYMPQSNQRIDVVCPNCGNIKTISINKLFSRGLCCICRDKISFANKFIFNILRQIGVRVKTEYSPKWACGKKYDDYLIDYNIIIENHGIQHYERGFADIGGRTLEEEQTNDVVKQQLAHTNNITYYIVLDCRYSTLEWIKSSILNSDLLKILNFNESDIDWYKALRYATNSLVFYAAELFNNGMSVKDIAGEIGYSEEAIRRWLRNATQLGVCNYDPVVSMHQHYNSIKKSVRCVELNQIFPSIVAASKFIKQNTRSNISKCCYHPNLTAGGYHWEFV